MGHVKGHAFTAEGIAEARNQFMTDPAVTQDVSRLSDFVEFLFEVVGRQQATVEEMQARFFGSTRPSS